MDATTLRQLTRELLDTHGLTHWAVNLSARATRTAGSCDYRNRTINMSIKVAAVRSEAETRATILHEIAHALTPGHGHDAVWSRRCREIGGNGQRLYVSTAAQREQLATWVGTCPDGHKIYRDRRPSGTASCASHGSRVYDPALAIRWARNDALNAL